MRSDEQFALALTARLIGDPLLAPGVCRPAAAFDPDAAEPSGVALFDPEAIVFTRR
jgi:hypothetical protein